jgi:catalase-peroxidase
MGPRVCYLGNEVPKEQLIWQDPIDKPKYKLKSKDIKDLKNKISKSKIPISDLVSTAWASASTFRGSDKRGGANGARIMLEPQKSWAVNNPKKLSTVIKALNKIKDQFDNKKKSVSMADLIVLAGGVGIEMAAKKAGHKVNVPFSAGRGDARQDQTDIHSFGLLEPQADGFRNYLNGGASNVSAEEKLVDKAQLMGLTAPEMTALIGGMRVLNTNYDGSNYGVFTNKPGSLTNDYFVNLLDMNTTWKEEDKSEQTFVGKDRKTQKTKWKATRVDLIFGSNSQLRALAEVYACEDSSEKFVKDFIAAWVKVMNSDRFDLKLN